ncbi:MAG: glycosyltransferase [Candidatus Wallbacteria bacterium]|nr:glycosyltransferase [Candidatus Wallbacteria bacterium]
MHTLFWLSFAYLGYTFVAFPLAVLLAAAWARSQQASGFGYGPPSVTVVFTFVPPGEPGGTSVEGIRERVRDIAVNGYEPRLLQAIGVSDGPMEGRAELERELVTATGLEVLLLEQRDRAGKTAAQNLAAKRASGEVLVFTDADTRFAFRAIEAISRPLGDPDVGCACGRLIYAGRSPESLYWSYETALKESEAALHSLMGANGALYAVRRRDYAELPPWALSDLVEPLYQLIDRRRTCWVPEAVAYEQTRRQTGDVFGRKRRITLRALGSLPLVLPIFNLKARPVATWLFVSHKLMRWFSWLPLAAIYFSSFALATDAFYARAAIVQLLFYMYSAGVYIAAPGATLPAYVVEVGAAQLVATLQWLFGRREVVWEPTGLSLGGRAAAR